MVLNMLPPEELSVSQNSKTRLRERKLQDIVRKQCVLTALRVITLHQWNLRDSARHKKKKSLSYTRKRKKATEQASRGGEVDVAESIS